MQKIFGFVLILAGCSGLGMWYCMQFRLRISNLKQMCHILCMLESYVRFGRSTMGECCNQIAGRVENPFKSGLQEIAMEMKKNQGSSLGQVSRKSLEKHLKKLVVSQREKEEFIACFVHEGYEDEGMQIQSIIRGRQELESARQKLNESLASRCKLAVSLGTMSGLLLVVLFL
ncbi:MAG: stage III sporulation protein AB [Lachnospiraceae bacterium]|nr:stage III sporulation protein AB [Lachnospiraceae bacterium]